MVDPENLSAFRERCYVESFVCRSRFRGFEIILSHALKAGSLGGTRRDPFDRMLIAQAQAEPAVVAASDPCFAAITYP